jgi:hypothetical protein
MRTYFLGMPSWFWFVCAVALAIGYVGNAVRAETMTVERVVPAGATLTYSEGGQVVRTISVPEGRVRVTIEYGGPVRPGHGKRSVAR